jgi:inhibitor of KinA
MRNATVLNQSLSVYYLSEQAVTVEFGQIIDAGLLDRVSKLNTLLYQQPFQGFSTTVPAYATLTVFFDPVLVGKSGLAGKNSLEKVSGYLQSLDRQEIAAVKRKVNTITIPVCYGGGFGPDLEELAKLHQLDVAELVRLHSAATYKVYMIGFVPGFAYLGGMDERLATPRKATPRKAVPAGSVGIAGQQTGVYPLQTPHSNYLM